MSNAWPKSKFNIVMLSSASTRRNNKNETYDNTLTKGTFILIEDNQTDGSFIIHHFLSLFLKSNANICLVGFAQTLVHYSTIAKKLGINLNNFKEKGQLKFIDGMSLFTECLEKTAENSNPIDTKQFYLKLKSEVVSWQDDNPVLLILDNISLLLNSGLDVNSVADFMHYCYTLTHSCNPNVSLLSLVHCDTDIVDSDSIYLRNQLSYYASNHISINGLETGYSKDVHGQIEVTKNSYKDTDSAVETKLMQYKLTDKGVDFFPVGTSAAVL